MTRSYVTDETQGFDAPSCDVTLKGHRVTMTWMSPDLLRHVTNDDIFGISVVAFSDTDEIVMADLARGIEIPAGTVEETDEDLEATVRREAWEEVRVTLGDIKLAQLVRLDWTDRHTSPAYIPVYAAKVETMPPFAQCHESRGRLLVSCEDYVDTFGFGPTEMRQQLITDAKAVLGQNTTIGSCVQSSPGHNGDIPPTRTAPVPPARPPR